MYHYGRQEVYLLRYAKLCIKHTKCDCDPALGFFSLEKNKLYVMRKHGYLNFGNVKLEKSSKKGGGLSGSWEFGQ